MEDSIPDNPPTPDELATLALIAEAEAEDIERQYKATQDAINEADAEAYRITMEAQRMVNDLKAKSADLRTGMWDQQREARKKRQEAESYLRQKEQAERAALAALEWATLEDRWDRLTLGAPWREWAKDHQIDGAKKITYEGRMILGDTMGLGKTLTSLIAIDMIQAATKDASPTHPVEFGSMN